VTPTTIVNKIFRTPNYFGGYTQPITLEQWLVSLSKGKQKKTVFWPAEERLDWAVFAAVGKIVLNPSPPLERSGKPSQGYRSSPVMTTDFSFWYPGINHQQSYKEFATWRARQQLSEQPSAAIAFRALVRTRDVRGGAVIRSLSQTIRLIPLKKKNQVERKKEVGNSG